jgi:hypothetical protein
MQDHTLVNGAIKPSFPIGCNRQPDTKMDAMQQDGGFAGGGLIDELP